MRYPSISLILSVIVCCYVIHTIWTLAGIFLPPSCSRGERCYSSYLSTKPELNLVIFTSIKKEPVTHDPSSAAAKDSFKKVHTSMKFDYQNPETIDLTLDIPRKTRKNGTMYMHVVLLDNKSLYKTFHEIWYTESLHTLPLVIHIQPQAATFNLLDQDYKKNDNTKEEQSHNVQISPYSHIATEVPLSILTDDLKLPETRIPGELYYHMRFRNGMFLPIIQHNILKTRLSQYQLLNLTTAEVNVTVKVTPISFGALRMALNLKMTMTQLMDFGFSHKDVDDVKGIFADTNLYLLSATVLIASFHLLFDFLAFKNDVSFWRRTHSYVGLSARTVIWRAVSQTIIFFYLLDEQTSLLVLIPAGINLLIELWKVAKIKHLRFERRGWLLYVFREKPQKEEETTAAADAEAMRYLSMLLYPLCLGGAVYTLIYEPQRSWYSWALRSTVNGVYAFGFLFMLPQLFVNYRLRSVAALPWRAFMYKAFNTFIDDVFAFMITMPTAHRVACFRDDLVFLIYLYQRWLYPVDKTRTDTASSMDEAPEPISAVPKQKTE